MGMRREGEFFCYFNAKAAGEDSSKHAVKQQQAMLWFSHEMNQQDIAWEFKNKNDHSNHITMYEIHLKSLKILAFF